MVIVLQLITAYTILVDGSVFFAAIILGINVHPVFADDGSNQTNTESDIQGANISGLRKIEDGSVISNVHTSKWRIFTDNGRDYFLQASIFCSTFYLSVLVSDLRSLPLPFINNREN